MHALGPLSQKPGGTTWQKTAGQRGGCEKLMLGGLDAWEINKKLGFLVRRKCQHDASEGASSSEPHTTPELWLCQPALCEGAQAMHDRQCGIYNCPPPLEQPSAICCQLCSRCDTFPCHTSKRKAQTIEPRAHTPWTPYTTRTEESTCGVIQGW